MDAATPAFIFMLTNQDRTVPDAESRLTEVLAAGIGHIGFKDVGLPEGELQRLTGRIRQAGATAYLEVVSLDEASERRSAEAALRLGVDVLMGGTRPEVVLPAIAGAGLRYAPFAGRIAGHPSRLEGTIEEILADAGRLAAMDGVTGLDLLAYRFAGDADLLVRRVCAAIAKPVVIAGSIDSAERIQAVVAAGAAGFTIGTAALDGLFDAPSRRLPDQLAAIRRHLETAVAAGRAGER
ncbi:MAG: hypothetical protein RIB84_02830 [Sneathiellaceae bacterium]